MSNQEVSREEQTQGRGGSEEPAAQLQLSSSRLMRKIYVGAGFFSLVVGLLGLLIPIFPTSPFLLLSAAFFARGSERFYWWLLNNPYCGQQIRSWRNNEGLTIRMKIMIIAAIAGTLTFSTLFFVPYVPVKIIMILIAIAITVYIWRQPTKRNADTRDG